ncbi:uncharacterized protein (DUF924 family) [Pelomonas saccharophila]|uniref:Uncharacterized protein (DUF924 family) n=1 Tax=Roseateles saccharophilus TaxID=304 RepID=A0ABU1YQI0_ROSSA|nr:DUF924 family protein [Roseateles saccharophilus]MDR7271119.1 uncharacterized protein (DUF924 family) [Roseateles saccharophilus]
MMVSREDILRFWFEETQPAQWWKVDPAFDELVRSRFGALHEQARRCELFAWRTTPEGRLAEVIALDQFARNIHRGTPGAFAADPLALALAQEAIAAGADLQLPVEQRAFLYMPYMHSESAAIHAVAEPLMRERAPQHTHEFELKHKAIIDRFGRYPHRNAILGRTSTAEEAEFLKQPGSSF